jgi:hypothetical protein
MSSSPVELSVLEEIVRFPSPTPAPQALAHDGQYLWIGSWETHRVYALEPNQAKVVEETTAPGRPVGATVVGDELRFVCSENGDADERFIRRFVPGHGFKTHDTVPCPDDTGSFLAYDGEALWLSQRYNKRLLELDARHEVLATVDAGEEIIGMTWSGAGLYLSTWLGKERGGCRIAYLEPRAPQPVLRFVAQAPFVAVSLAWDGDRLWTNDFKKSEVVAFRLPA